MTTRDSGQQALNLVDRAMLTTHRAHQAAGRAGFAVQMHVWLRRRLDVSALQAALARLSRRHPITTSRLVLPVGKADIHWRFRPGQDCRVHVSLREATDAEILRHAEDLLATPRDLSRSDPIRFNLMRLADGRDMLLIQYDHALMDANALPLLLGEIDRLAADAPAEAIAAVETPDEIQAYLARHSQGTRFRAVWGTIRETFRLQSYRPVTLARPGATCRGAGPPRILLRSLDERQTEALTARALEVSGFPSLSMTLLASVFRALGRQTSQALRHRSRFIAPIGTNLRPRGAPRPIFSNVASLLTVSVEPHELGDRNGLIRSLNRQMREGVQRGRELGILHFLSMVSPRHRLGRWPTPRLLRHQSVYFGYFGPLAARGDLLCGAEIDTVYQVAPSWCPPGLSVGVNQCLGRLVVAVTHCRDIVPEATADAFVDALVDDLVA